MADEKLDASLGANFDEVIAQLAADACAPIVRGGDALYGILLVSIGVSPDVQRLSASVVMRRRTIPSMPADEGDLSNELNNVLRLATLDTAIEALLAYKLRLEAAAAGAEKPQS